MPLTESQLAAIESSIAEATGMRFRADSCRAVTGGSINRACHLRSGDAQYFVKLNSAQRLAMFEAESAGLQAIRDTATVRAPAPLTSAASDSLSWLVLDYIPLAPPPPPAADLFGEQLAALHRVTSPTFGWYRDNTIGSTLQVNSPGEDWAAFFAGHRLGYQLSLARDNGAGATLLESGARLQRAVPQFFRDYRPRPSLLHGDLWGGNWGCDELGRPVVFDPACYFGDREADLAMTELFGGFDDRFYQSYVSVWAIDPGYSARKVLYNLYHVLNHFNLFGGAYAAQAQQMIDRLIAEVS